MNEKPSYCKIMARKAEENDSAGFHRTVQEGLGDINNKLLSVIHSFSSADVPIILAAMKTLTACMENDMRVNGCDDGLQLTQYIMEKTKIVSLHVDGDMIDLLKKIRETDDE